MNRLDCQIQNGAVEIWGARVTAETQDGTQVPTGQVAGHAYVRPHDIEFIQSGSAQPATVRHVAAAGPTARIELEIEGIPHLIESELPRQRYLELGLKAGQKVMIEARSARVFRRNSLNT